MNKTTKRIVAIVLVAVLSISALYCPTTVAKKKKYKLKFKSYEKMKYNLNDYVLKNAKAYAEAKEKASLADLQRAHGKYKDEAILNMIDDLIMLKISEDDIEEMAHLIYNEVGTDGARSMYCCGSVVLNRVKSKHFPNTIHDVIFQKGQYAVTWNGTFEREPSKEAYRIAKDLVMHGSVIPEEVVYQAEFFQGSDVYEEIGRTYYCYY